MKQGRQDDPRKPKDSLGYVSPYRAKLKKDINNFDKDLGKAFKANHKFRAIQQKVASNKAAKAIENNNRSVRPDNTRVTPRKK